MPRGIPKNKTAAPAADAAPKRRGRPPKNPAAVATAAAPADAPKKRGPYKKKGLLAPKSMGTGKIAVADVALVPSDLIQRIAAIRSSIETLSHVGGPVAQEEVAHQIYLLNKMSEQLSGIPAANGVAEEEEPATTVAAPQTTHTVPVPAVTMPPSFAPPPFPPVNS